MKQTLVVSRPWSPMVSFFLRQEKGLRKYIQKGTHLGLFVDSTGCRNSLWIREGGWGCLTTLSPVTGSIVRMGVTIPRWPNYSGYSIKQCIIHCSLSRDMHFLLHCVWYVVRKRTLFLSVSSPGQGTCDYIYLYLCGIAAKMVAKPRLKTRNLIAPHRCAVERDLYNPPMLWKRHREAVYSALDAPHKV